MARRSLARSARRSAGVGAPACRNASRCRASISCMASAAAAGRECAVVTSSMLSLLVFPAPTLPEDAPAHGAAENTRLLRKRQPQEGGLAGARGERRALRIIDAHVDDHRPALGSERGRLADRARKRRVLGKVDEGGAGRRRDAFEVELAEDGAGLAIVR